MDFYLPLAQNEMLFTQCTTASLTDWINEKNQTEYQDRQNKLSFHIKIQEE